MKQIKNNLNAINDNLNKEEIFVIANEGSCSPEFTEGCIMSERNPSFLLG